MLNVTAVDLKPGDILTPGNERVVSITLTDKHMIDVAFIASNRKRPEVWRLPPRWPLRIRERSQ